MAAARVHIVCFSMDRVFQLSEYLRTLHQHVLFHGARLVDDHAWARIMIVAKCSTPAIRAHYDAIAALYAHVQFLFETTDDEEGGSDFATRFLESVQYGTIDGADDEMEGSDLVLLNVDDAFYYEDIDLAMADSFFQSSPSTVEGDVSVPWHFAFHLKLAPSIWRSHLTNLPMLPLPPMTTVLPTATTATAMALTFDATESIYLTFDPARGALDWSYPWELSGSVYTRATVLRVLNAIQTQFGRDGISRPNFLELRGHEVVTKQWLNQTHPMQCACMPRPKMHVFAINQVQDVFDNRLYTAEQIMASSRSPSSRDLKNLLEKDSASSQTSQNGELGQLLHLYESSETLDEVYYRRHRFSSVHIGTLVLSSALNSQPRARGSVDWTADHTPLVSVVMPVFNAEAFVDEALRSVLQQTYAQMEIIVIDDASTDDSSRIIATRMAGDPRVKYVRNDTNMGISASLNKGFSMAQGTFVARMDADDISFPDRIQRQIHFMLEHPFVDILGTSIIVGRYHSDVDTDDASHIETACYPTSPLATRWQLLFGCFVAHPTVMMHRRVLNTIVATSHELYSTSQPACEDYDLWLRCAYGHELTIMSLGDVLLFHRKHAGNSCLTRRSEQLQQTQRTATKWCQQLLGEESEEVDATAIQPLLDHDGVYTADQLQRAIALLKRLEAKFVIPTKRDISRTSSPSISPQEQEMRQDEWAAEQQYVHNDAAARHGELAFRAMLAEPALGAALWSEFALAYPELSRAAFEKLMQQKNACGK